MPDPNFSGPEYEPSRDHRRLANQHQRIATLMLDGHWRTVREIHWATGYPENSIQAQLRHLRKPRFGGLIVDKRRTDGGLYEYHVRRRTTADPPYQGGTRAKGDRADALEELLDQALRHLREGDCAEVRLADEIQEAVNAL